MADLWQVDNDLARGLRNLLEFPEGEGSIEEVFGITYTASKNPLIDNVVAASKEIHYIDLLGNGQNLFVNRSNRQNFVDLFVKYALQKCCSEAIGRYFQGIQVLFPSRFVNMCGHEELEHIICGSTDIGDLSELRIHTAYRGKFNDEHPIINWFWVRRCFQFPNIR